MKTIERNLKPEMQATQGKFFKVTWYKQNGELREAVAQTNVRKGINGTGRLWQDKENQLTAYEKATGRRIVITTDRVVEFQCGSVHHLAEQ